MIELRFAIQVRPDPENKLPTGQRFDYYGTRAEAERARQFRLRRGRFVGDEVEERPGESWRLGYVSLGEKIEIIEA